MGDNERRELNSEALKRALVSHEIEQRRRKAEQQRPIIINPSGPEPKVVEKHVERYVYVERVIEKPAKPPANPNPPGYRWDVWRGKWIKEEEATATGTGIMYLVLVPCAVGLCFLWPPLSVVFVIVGLLMAYSHLKPKA